MARGGVQGGGKRWGRERGLEAQGAQGRNCIGEVEKGLVSRREKEASNRALPSVQEDRGSLAGDEEEVEGEEEKKKWGKNGDEVHHVSLS